RPPGIGTSQAQAVHGRFGTGSGEADAFAAGNRLTQQGRQLGVQLILVGAGGAAGQDPLHGLANPGIAVAQQRGAVAAAQINVRPAVEVPDAAALRPVNEQGMAEGSVETRRRGHAAGQVLTGSLVLLYHSAHEVLRPLSRSQKFSHTEAARGAMLSRP